MALICLVWAASAHAEQVRVFNACAYPVQVSIEFPDHVVNQVIPPNEPGQSIPANVGDAPTVVCYNLLTNDTDSSNLQGLHARQTEWAIVSDESPGVPNVMNLVFDNDGEWVGLLTTEDLIFSVIFAWFLGWSILKGVEFGSRR